MREVGIFADETVSLFTNMMLNQYLVALGEFRTDNYIDHELAPLLWTLFILATLFT